MTYEPVPDRFSERINALTAATMPENAVLTDADIEATCTSGDWIGSLYEANMRVQSSRTRYSCPKCGALLVEVREGKEPHPAADLKIDVEGAKARAQRPLN